mmetsp:Transcript_52747/g.153399  ORF Transcript_52747/g.153399 Transcript_52747/m.153399 type:complete len:204 (+) Transcript_52747:246-857(+)
MQVPFGLQLGLLAHRILVLERSCQSIPLPPFPPGMIWKMSLSWSRGSLHAGHGTDPTPCARPAHVWVTGCIANHCLMQSPQKRCEHRVSLGTQPTKWTKQILQTNSSVICLLPSSMLSTWSLSTLTSASASSCNCVPGAPTSTLAGGSAILPRSCWGPLATLCCSLNWRNSCSIRPRIAPSLAREACLGSSSPVQCRTCARWS